MAEFADTSPLAPSERPPSRHGYWGPLPGETPALYKAIGAPTLEKLILDHVPYGFRGEFNMEAGRDPEVGPPIGPDNPPLVLSREEKLERLVDFTKANEVAHLGLFAFLGAMSAAGAIEGNAVSIGGATAIGVLNIAANVPAIIVQRYNRLRAYRLLDKMDRPL